ncbi:hypothetical protein PR048_026707 [Dryococelus australis]|uniref:Uncharacterized protein n=1 Tax=Dryococelus australis TaxID=614101 RepID=A0ABQ9GM34_9NEOP|nr:hypothetical protein PR048_026707 [Dryococelus australis]
MELLPVHRYELCWAHVTQRSRYKMRRAGETGAHGENTSYYSNVGVHFSLDPTGNRTRFASMGGELSDRYNITDPTRTVSLHVPDKLSTSLLMFAKLLSLSSPSLATTEAVALQVLVYKKQVASPVSLILGETLLFTFISKTSRMLRYILRFVDTRKCALVVGGWLASRGQGVVQGRRREHDPSRVAADRGSGTLTAASSPGEREARWSVKRVQSQRRAQRPEAGMARQCWCCEARRLTTPGLFCDGNGRHAAEEYVGGSQPAERCTIQRPPWCTSVGGRQEPARDEHRSMSIASPTCDCTDDRCGRYCAPTACIPTTCKQCNTCSPMTTLPVCSFPPGCRNTWAQCPSFCSPTRRRSQVRASPTAAMGTRQSARCHGNQHPGKVFSQRVVRCAWLTAHRPTLLWQWQCYCSPLQEVPGQHPSRVIGRCAVRGPPADVSTAGWGSSTLRKDLNTAFPLHWIRRGGPVSWPERSSDLYPLDFFVWGCLKSRVYDGPRPNTRAWLQQAITDAADQLRADLPRMQLQHSSLRTGGWGKFGAAGVIHSIFLYSSAIKVYRTATPFLYMDVLLSMSCRIHCRRMSVESRNIRYWYIGIGYDQCAGIAVTTRGVALDTGFEATAQFTKHRAKIATHKLAKKCAEDEGICGSGKVSDFQRQANNPPANSTHKARRGPVTIIYVNEHTWWERSVDGATRSKEVAVCGRPRRHMRNAGRPRSVLTVRLEEVIRQYINDMRSASTRSIERQMGVSHSTAWDVLWVERRHPYHWQKRLTRYVVEGRMLLITCVYRALQRTPTLLKPHFDGSGMQKQHHWDTFMWDRSLDSTDTSRNNRTRDEKCTSCCAWKLCSKQKSKTCRAICESPLLLHEGVRLFRSTVTAAEYAGSKLHSTLIVRNDAAGYRTSVLAAEAGRPTSRGSSEVDVEVKALVGGGGGGGRGQDTQDNWPGRAGRGCCYHRELTFSPGAHTASQQVEKSAPDSCAVLAAASTFKPRPCYNCTLQMRHTNYSFSAHVPNIHLPQKPQLSKHVVNVPYEPRPNHSRIPLEIITCILKTGHIGVPLPWKLEVSSSGLRTLPSLPKNRLPNADKWACHPGVTASRLPAVFAHVKIHTAGRNDCRR